MSESVPPETVEDGIMTTIKKPYHFPKYDLSKPEPLNDPFSKPMFAGPNREIYNQHYIKLREFNQFPKIPAAKDFDSYDKYQNALSEWQQAVTKFSQSLCLPTTVGHYIPRPAPPIIITQENREDRKFMGKLKREYNPEKSNAFPGNAIVVQDIMDSGEPFAYEDLLPYSGMVGKSVPVHAHIEANDQWLTQLIPARPEPDLYEYFDDYEDAMIRWANIVKEIEFIPPTPTEIGELIDLKKVVESNELTPPLPPMMPAKPPKPMTVFKCKSKETKHNLKKLFKTYTKWQAKAIALTPESKKGKIPTLKGKTYTPPHAGANEANLIRQNYIDYGVPYTNFAPSLSEANTNYSSTQIRRMELMTYDVGAMATPDLIERGKYTVKLDITKLVNMLNEDVYKFLLADMSPHSYQMLLYKETSEPGVTVGKLLTKKLTIENLVKFSMASTSMRFLTRCSITAQYFLGDESTASQVLDLMIPHLERFVELLAISAPYSFTVSDLPEDELSAAIAASPKQDQQIEQFANDFRQAQLLKCLQSIVFTSPNTFFPFFAIIRPLIHECFCRISKIVTSDVTFPLISEGFMSEDIQVHNFYYKILRTIVQIEYSKLIRVFSIHDLFKFFHTCVISENPVIRHDSNSLWQLTMHSDSSLALRMQMLKIKPTIIVKMLKESPPTMQQNLLGVFSLFRCNDAEFDYRPFPLDRYTYFIDLLCQSLDNPICIRALELLLGMMTDYQSIYCQNRNDLKEYANQIMRVNALQMMTPTLVRCLRILCKNELLESSEVNNQHIWSWVFGTILQRGTDVDTIRLLWEVFRNAVLHQAGFVNFILENSELVKLLEDAFSSIDENVSSCMILILPDLSRKRSVGGGEDHSRHNLEQLFTKLSDSKTVRIDGRLLAAYQFDNQSSLMARVHSALVEFLKALIRAPSKSYLGQFKASIDKTLKDVFIDVEKKTMKD